MNCQNFHVQHLAFVDLGLPSETHAEMVQHRDACEACDRFDTAVRRALLVARNLPEVRPSTAFGLRLDAKLRAARLAALETQGASRLRRPATVRTMMVVAASLVGMLYLTDPGAREPVTSGMAIASAGGIGDAVRAVEVRRPTPHIYSAPLRSPAVVTVVSMASNAEWMSPTPSAPAPSAFAPASLEAVALVR